MGEMSTPEASRQGNEGENNEASDMIFTRHRQGGEGETLDRDQVMPNLVELNTESAKLSSLCLQCPH